MGAGAINRHGLVQIILHDLAITTVVQELLSLGRSRFAAMRICSVGRSPANDRTIRIRLQQRALQASSSGTSAVARLAELARLARVGKCAGLIERRGV